MMTKIQKWGNSLTKFYRYLTPVSIEGRTIWMHPAHYIHRYHGVMAILRDDLALKHLVAEEWLKNQ